MKSFFFTALCVALLSVSTLCFGFDCPEIYVHGFGGPNYLVVKNTGDIKIKSRPGYLIGIGAGLKFDRTRTEVEISYRYNDFEENIPVGLNIFFDHGKSDKFAGFFNFYYDFPVEFLIDYLQPYLGAGIGYKHDHEKAQLKLYDYDGSIYTDIYKFNANGVTCQLITGLSLPMSRCSVTRIEYRFLKDETDLTNHSFVLNLALSF